MINAIDEKLIAAHQWVVDETQKQPAWLARQAAILIFICGGIRYYSAQDWLGLVATVLLAGLYFVVSFSPAHFNSAGAAVGIRIVLMCMWVGQIAIQVAADKFSALMLISNLSIVFWNYLAACKPPRPRQPKHQFNPEAA